MLPAAPLPTGTVAFLFTHIECSTRLPEEQPEAMRRALRRHDVLLCPARRGPALSPSTRTPVEVRRRGMEKAARNRAARQCARVGRT